jgi:uncharacterized SAM-binding protein YcdF (DUF218 family)
VIKRVAAALILLWALGFALFAVTLAQPLEGRTTDAIVVPTGGPGRITRGIELMGRKQAKRMLITGVARDVRPIELAIANDAPPALFACCIDLGRAAVDTRSNGLETAHWIERRGFKSVRLVTTDWHMARAHYELRSALGPDIEIVDDAVRSSPGLGVLLREYNKFLLARTAGMAGL